MLKIETNPVSCVSRRMQVNKYNEAGTADAEEGKKINRELTRIYANKKPDFLNHNFAGLVF